MHLTVLGREVGEAARAIASLWGCYICFLTCSRVNCTGEAHRCLRVRAATPVGCSDSSVAGEWMLTGNFSSAGGLVVVLEASGIFVSGLL